MIRKIRIILCLVLVAVGWVFLMHWIGATENASRADTNKEQGMESMKKLLAEQEKKPASGAPSSSGAPSPSGGSEPATIETDPDIKLTIKKLDLEDGKVRLNLGLTNAAGGPLERPELIYQILEDGKSVAQGRFEAPGSKKPSASETPGTSPPDETKPAPASQGVTTSQTRMCLVMDYSLSMKKNKKIDAAKKAALTLLGTLTSENDELGIFGVNDRLAGTTKKFRTNTMERLSYGPLGPPDSKRRKLAAIAINETPMADGTPLMLAMKMAARGMAKQQGKRVMLVLTDGKDTDKKLGEQHMEEAIKVCKANGIKVYLISFPGTNNDEVMNKIASETGGKHLHTTLPGDLAVTTTTPASNPESPAPPRKQPPKDKLSQQFLDVSKAALEQEYTVSYVSPNQAHDGRPRQVAVTVASRGKGNQTSTQYHVGGVAAVGVESTLPKETPKTKEDAPTAKEDKPKDKPEAEPVAQDKPKDAAVDALVDRRFIFFPLLMLLGLLLVLPPVIGVMRR